MSVLYEYDLPNIFSPHMIEIPFSKIAPVYRNVWARRSNGYPI